MARGALSASRTRRVAVIVVLLFSLFGAFVACTVAVEHRDEMPASWAMRTGQFDPELMPDPRETTEQTCTENLPCRWAVTSQTAVIMKFDDQMDACRAAEALPDTVRHDWLAIRFIPGALSQEQRDSLVWYLDGYRHSSDAMDDFPWIIRPCP